MRRSYGTPREYTPHDIIQHPPHSQTLSQILIIMYFVKRLLIFISSCYHFVVFRTLTQDLDFLKHHPTAIVLIHPIYFWLCVTVIPQRIASPTVMPCAVTVIILLGKNYFYSISI